MTEETSDAINNSSCRKELYKYDLNGNVVEAEEYIGEQLNEKITCKIFPQVVK